MTPDFSTPANLPPPIPRPDEEPGPHHTPSLVLVKQTLLDAVLMVMVNLILILALSGLHLTMLLPGQENVAALRKMRALSPALLFVAAILLAPVLEESLFRGLPYLLSRFLERRQLVSEATRPLRCWAIGGTAAILFALTHADRGPIFHLPLAQLLFGLFSWRIINDRGLRYSMLFHATHNFILISFFLVAKQ